MTTINANVWLLIKDKSDPQRVFDQYVTVYHYTDNERYAWLLLYYAVQASHMELVRQILVDDASLWEKLGVKTQGAVLHSGNIVTALNEAVRRDDVAMAELILSLHPDITEHSGYLFFSESSGVISCSPLELAIYKDHVDVLRILVQYFSWGSSRDHHRTLLHYATTYASPKCLAFLLSLQQGMDQINMKNEEGFTPLLLAARYQPQFIQIILQHGADIHACHDPSGDNALHSLCRGTMRPRSDWVSDGDPCPNVDINRRPRNLFIPTEDVYIVPNFVELAKVLVESGLDVNAPTPPLKMFCHNIRRKLQDLLNDDDVKVIYRNAISYLSSITARSVVDECLLSLSHQLQFLCTQLRRSNDYDNIMRHVDLMELIRECIYMLLDNRANPNSVETVEEPVKRMRGLQYLIPFNIPGSRELKGLLDAECQKLQPEQENRMTAPDIILVALLVFYPVQLEEPEIHTRGLNIILEIFQRLSQDGAKCRQLLQLFIVLSVDPIKNFVFLDAYLESQSQADYHDVLSQLLRLSHMNDAFAEVQNHLSPFLVRMFSLKDLLRRDIIRHLGSGKCPEKVDQLPLPTVLKKYLIEFWEIRYK